MSGARRKNRRSWIARLVSVSLLLQALLTAWSGPLMAAMQQADIGPYSRTIVICTPDGVRRITLDQNGNPSDRSDPPSPDQTCIICLSLAHNSQAALISVNVVIAPLLTYIGTDYVVAADILDDRRPYVRCGLDPPGQS